MDDERLLDWMKEMFWTDYRPALMRLSLLRNAIATIGLTVIWFVLFKIVLVNYFYPKWVATLFLVMMLIAYLNAEYRDVNFRSEEASKELTKFSQEVLRRIE